MRACCAHLSSKVTQQSRRDGAHPLAVAARRAEKCKCMQDVEERSLAETVAGVKVEMPGYRPGDIEVNLDIVGAGPQYQILRETEGGKNEVISLECSD